MKISGNKIQERYFFLFNDVLIYTQKSKISNSYTFRGTIDLDKIHIEDLADTSSLKDAIQITRLDTNKTYVIYARSSKEKASWLRELELQVQNLTIKRSLSCQREEALAMKNVVEPLGGSLVNRPIWKPDSTTENCTKCNGKFTFLNRRHHCRYPSTSSLVFPLQCYILRTNFLRSVL